jgi:hypothetical protein
MPRVVPSQVVELIDQLFPQSAVNKKLRIGSGPQSAAVVNLVKEIPPELLALSGQDLSDYYVALTMIENTEQARLALQRGLEVPEHRGMSTIFLLRSVLAKCPDEVPAPGTAELLFITDVDLRENIRRDISAANQDIVNGEWKGATVLAGSATEALLLWSVQEAECKSKGAILRAVTALVSAAVLLQKPHPKPERWNLGELIEVASHLALVTPDTAIQARLGKDFRNLIHPGPGRAARLGQACDRATALSALAAVEHVVRDLS